MSSSSLSDVDSDIFASESPPGDLPKDSAPKAASAKESPCMPEKAQSPRTPSPASGAPQSSPEKSPGKRSADEAGLESAPPPKRAEVEAQTATEAPSVRGDAQPKLKLKSKKRSAPAAELEEATPSKKIPPPPKEPIGNSRPSRNKTRPSRLGEEIEASPPKSATAPTSSSASTATPKKRRAGPWDADRLLHSTSSRLLQLGTSQLKKVLLDSRAWTCLSGADKDELIALLPPESLPRLLEDNTEPDMLHEYLRYNEVFSDDIARFLEQLGDGQLDPGWMAQAGEAMEMRARGDFDAWKEKEFEEFWGQKHEFVPSGPLKAKVNGNGKEGCEEMRMGKQEQM